MFHILNFGIFQTKSAKEAAVATYSKQSQRLGVHHKEVGQRLLNRNPLFTAGSRSTVLKAV